MTAITFEDGKYRDENGNRLEIWEVKGKYLGHHCGHPSCDCRPASMWDTRNDQFVCAACAKELNTRKALMFGPGAVPRCVEPPKS